MFEGSGERRRRAIVFSFLLIVFAKRHADTMHFANAGRNERHDSIGRTAVAFAKGKPAG